jgi:hypothetical protein
MKIVWEVMIIWIVKTDSLGNIQWQNTIGGSDHDDLIFLEQTTDGGYILGWKFHIRYFWR